MQTTDEPDEPPVRVSAAHGRDAEAIAELLRRNSGEPTLLLQPAGRVLRQIDEFVVARSRGESRGENRGEIIGCAQLHEHRPGVFELMSVAVDPEHHGRGVGRACARACVDRGLGRAPRLLWLATTSPGFFARIGFVRTSMATIPFAVLLAKLGAVVAQPAGRWPAALFGGQIFMRWPNRQ